jgi:curved DNA-binding protein CbpA
VSASRDPYEVLGVPRNATVRQIRAAYVERARRVHPDLVGMRGLDGMRALNEAWAVLKDADRRAAFDAETATGATSAEGSGAGSRMDEDPNRPFWTGAMGPAPGRPWGPVLDWGIFAGWSLGEISRRDRGYLMWLRDRPEAKPYRAEIARLLDPTADEPPPEPQRGRRR